MKFTNPHGSPALAGRDRNTPSTGVLTLGSATALAPRGIGATRANELHTETRLNRDETEVKFLPAREYRPPGFLKTVITRDGCEIQIFAGNPND